MYYTEGRKPESFSQNSLLFRGEEGGGGGQVNFINKDPNKVHI